MNREELVEKWGVPQVVDNEGFVRLVDFMGDDPAVPQAARVSYAGGTKTVREDCQLTRFLMRLEHYSPFAMAQVKLHLRLPIFVHNQFVRHDRFAWNVMSGRYSEMPEESWTPEPGDVRGQGQGNKQVGDGDLDGDANVDAVDLIKDAYIAGRRAYECMLDDGVCREQARTVLPMGQYTEAYVTANLGDWLLFLKARLSPHAQVEIRLFAEAIHNIFMDLFPNTMLAFNDYQRHAVTFSAQEHSVLKSLAAGVLGTRVKELKNLKLEEEQELTSHGWKLVYKIWVGDNRIQFFAKPLTVFDLEAEDRVEFLKRHGLTNKRERQEFFKKLKA